MSVTRKRRKADGRLRPAVARARAKKSTRQRQEWLAQFAPGARDEFFRNVVVADAVFLSGFAREFRLDRAAAAAELEEIAEDRRWRKLRTADGTVVGIAPPRPRTQEPVIHVP